MEQLKETVDKCSTIMTAIAELLQIVSEKKVNESNIELITNFYLCFALSSQNYSNILLQYRLLEHTSKMDNDVFKLEYDKFLQQFNAIKNILKQMENKQIKTILLSLERLDVQKVGKSDEFSNLPDFFERHKAQFEKWSRKPPSKEKLIKALELWTGSRGEQAVISTLRELRDSAEKMTHHVAEVYGMRFDFNRSLDLLYNETFQSLLKYYIEHRNKYVGNEFVLQKIEIGRVMRFALQDDFIKLNMEFRKCNFTQFKPFIHRIMKALDEIDFSVVKAMMKILVKEVDSIPNIDSPSEELNLLARKTAKTEILDAVDIMADNLECLQIEPSSISFYGENTIESILKNIKEFLIVERETVSKAKDIENMFKLQTENIDLLRDRINYLVGESVEPCIRRIFQLLAPMIIMEKNKTDYDRESWQTMLDFKWNNLFTKDRRYFTKEFDALLRHIFCTQI